MWIIDNNNVINLNLVTTFIKRKNTILIEIDFDSKIINTINEKNEDKFEILKNKLENSSDFLILDNIIIRIKKIIKIDLREEKIMIRYCYREVDSKSHYINCESKENAELIFSMIIGQICDERLIL